MITHDMKRHSWSLWRLTFEGTLRFVTSPPTKLIPFLVRVLINSSANICYVTSLAQSVGNSRKNKMLSLTIRNLESLVGVAYTWRHSYNTVVVCSNRWGSKEWSYLEERGICLRNSCYMFEDNASPRVDDKFVILQVTCSLWSWRYWGCFPFKCGTIVNFLHEGGTAPSHTCPAF